MINNYCMNCDKYGHNNKVCTKPIISCGIICFKLDNLPITKIEKFLFNKFIDVEEYNYKNLNYINKINKYNIKFLLIQRKHSLSFIQFIRGKYDEHNLNEIKSLFELMSKIEVCDIKLYDFNFLWNKVWLKTAKNKIYMKEQNIAKIKFNYLKSNNIINNFDALYDTPEWGFPKGRRNKFENNLDCANREFKEETNIDNYILFNRINTIEETFYGTDNNNYKHIYYLAGLNEDENNTLEETKYNFEIGNIGWFSLEEILLLLRPYNKSKICLINQLYFFLSILIDKINNNINNYIFI